MEKHTMIHKPKSLYPHVIHRQIMKDLTASLLYEGMRDKAGMKDVRISIRGVRMAGNGVFIPASESELLPDSVQTLDNFAITGYDWFSVEGTYDTPKANPSLRMTRAEFLVDLLDRLEGLRESLKYSPALYENVSAEIGVAEHYIKGAYDVAELADLTYFEEKETEFANLEL